MKAFVIGDVHGDYTLLTAVLRKSEIIDTRGKRIDHESLVIQVGDLINNVAEPAKDLACLSRVGDWIDVLVCGNHEYPSIVGERFKFKGWFDRPEINERIRKLFLGGVIVPCVNLDGLLVTHAGVSEQHNWETAEEAARAITIRWLSNPTDPLFSDVGTARKGFKGYGGILWADQCEPKNTRFRQMVGHSPMKGITVRQGTIYIDLGSKSLACVTVEDGRAGMTQIAHRRKKPS